MRPFLDDASLIDHEDFVGVADGGKAMSDDDNRAAGKEIVYRFLN